MLFYMLRWLRSLLLIGIPYYWDSCWDDIVLRGPCRVWKESSKIGFYTFVICLCIFKFCIGQFLPCYLAFGLSYFYLLIMFHIWHYRSGKKCGSLSYSWVYFFFGLVPTRSWAWEIFVQLQITNIAMEKNYLCFQRYLDLSGFHLNIIRQKNTEFGSPRFRVLAPWCNS